MLGPQKKRQGSARGFNRTVSDTGLACLFPLLFFFLLLCSGSSHAQEAGRRAESARNTAAESGWTLQYCLHAALMHSPEIEQQRLALELARAKVVEARSAFFPQIDFQLQAAHQTPLVDDLGIDLNSILGDLLGTYNINGFPTTTTVDQEDPEIGPPYNDPTLPLPSPNNALDDLGIFPEDIVTIGFVAQQPLYTSGKLREGQRLSRLNVSLQQRTLEARSYQTAYLVRQLYISIRMANASIALLEEMQREIGEIVSDTNHLRAQGFVTQADVLEARSNLRQVEAQRDKAIAERVQALEALRLLMGLPPEAPMKVTGPLKDLSDQPIPSSPELLEQALKRRPELSSRRLQASMAQQQVKLNVADLNFRPLAALSFEGGIRGTKYPLIETNWSHEWESYVQLGVVLKFGVFDGKAASSRLRQARIQLEQADLGVEQTQALLQGEIRRERAKSSASQSAVKSALANEQARQERWANAEKSYKTGDLGRTEFLETQLSWIEARVSKLMALYNLQMALLELDKVSGRLPRSPEEVE